MNEQVPDAKPQQKSPNRRLTHKSLAILLATATLAAGIAEGVSGGEKTRGGLPLRARYEYYTPNYHTSGNQSPYPKGVNPNDPNIAPPPGTVRFGGESVGVIYFPQADSSYKAGEMAQETLQVINGEEMPNQVFNGVMVLPAGTTLNRAPMSEKVDGYVTVGQDQLAILSKPRLYIDGTDSEHPKVWAIVTTAGSGRNKATDIQQSYWVDVSQLQNQPGFEAFVNAGEETAPNLLPVKLNAEGNLTSNNNSVPSAELASFSIIPETSMIPSGGGSVGQTLKALGLVRYELPVIGQ